MIESFEGEAASRWRVFTDQVMGGVSEGRAEIGREGPRAYLRLQGNVSTANRGGFIQARCEVSGLSGNGLVLETRGDGQEYFIHLRTTWTVLPWQFYQAGFDTLGMWQETRLPFEAFTARGRGLIAGLRAEQIRSVAIAAYGRDHIADVSVARIATY